MFILNLNHRFISFFKLGKTSHSQNSLLQRIKYFEKYDKFYGDDNLGGNFLTLAKSFRVCEVFL